jgi:carbon monoxide dehydrogenase subunit G
MKLENEFRVSVPVDRAWEVLTNIPLITPCLPGATLTDHDGEEYKGKIKIKVGPVTADYSGSAVFVQRDETARRVEISASGRDSRGSGNASATITADMATDGDGTRVSIVTDLKISGKVAQFGKAIIEQVAAESAGGAGGAGGGAAQTAARPRPQQVETLDLMEYAGSSVYKRVIPAAAVIALLIVLRMVVKRR